MNTGIELKGFNKGCHLIIPTHYVGKHKRALSKVTKDIKEGMSVPEFIMDYLERFANALFEMTDKEGKPVEITKEIVDNMEIDEFDLVKEKVNRAIIMISGVKKKDKMKSGNTTKKHSQPKGEVLK